MTPELVSRRPSRPVREVGAHKGDFGRVLIVAGSRNMSGAACLAGVAALRGGAGLVTVAVPRSIQPVVASYEPSYLTMGLPEDDSGQFTAAAREGLALALNDKNAVAIGPGMGQSPALKELVSHLYDKVTAPLICDADALNALAICQKSLSRRPDQPARILTPHPGEFARLVGKTTAEIQEHREQEAFEFARQNGIVLVLKGAGTVITDGRRLAINDTGNAGMATGGTGDVLTGLMAALLAQGMEPLDAAHLAVWLHGRAGDLAANELSEPGLIASDLLWFLAQAWRDAI